MRAQASAAGAGRPYGYEPAGDAAGFFTYNLRGCGAALCPPISLVQLGESQFYNGGPLAVADHKIFMASTDNTDGHSNVYTATLP